MPLPSNYSTRTVHGRWIAFPDGAPATGTVTFRASVAHLVSSSDELVILTRLISVDLDGNGEATVELPTTSDPDISPTGFTYAVTETLGANGSERAYSIDVPEDTVNLELATVTPVAAVDDVSPYLLVADRGSPGGVAALDSAGTVPRAQLPTTVDSVNGATGDVSLNASDVGALPDTFTAPVQSVNTQIGDVNLSASDVGAAGSGHNHDTAYAAAGHNHDAAYAASGHSHDHPVDSVDGMTGAVDLSTSYAASGHNHDADYAAAGHGHDYPVDSVDGRTGAVTLGDLYADASHAHSHPVTSVNTQTGDVTLDAADVGASPDTHHHDTEYAALGHDHDFPVDSVDGRTGMVTLDDLYAAISHNHDAAYAAAGHGHDYPVDSVNGETGAVNLSAADVGASPDTHNHDAAYAASGHNHDASYAAAGHNHDAAYAAAGHGHSTFAGSSVDIENGNNIQDGDPPPFRINDPSGGELVMDQNQLQHNDADGSPGPLFIGSPVHIGGLGVGRTVNAVDFGRENAVTFSSGIARVPHSLGIAPGAMFAVADNDLYNMGARDGTSTDFEVRAQDVNGNPVNGSPAFNWLAIA